jgi:hypothetical protein
LKILIADFHVLELFMAKKHDFAAGAVLRLTLCHAYSLPVLDHFTKKTFHRIFLTERLFTEKSVDRTPFGRIPFDQKAI